MYLKHILENQEVKVEYSDLFGDWNNLLIDLFTSSYMTNLSFFIKELYDVKERVYPKKENLFTPFKKTKFKDLKVVCFGLAPNYLSNGLAYSINEKDSFNKKHGVTEDIKNCVNTTIYEDDSQWFDYSMNYWAKNNILLLNTSLTKNNNEDHGIYWKNFIREIIFMINKNKKDIVFLFLETGNEHFKKYIDLNKHYIIENENFFSLEKENNIFNNVNDKLKNLNIEHIVW